MASVDFPVPQPFHPRIYAYEDSNPQYAGLLKVGYTAGDVEARVKDQYPTLRPGPLPYRIVLTEDAVREDGSYFQDHRVHQILRDRGVENPRGEWFRCSVNEVRSAILEAQTGKREESGRTRTFKMRPEQVEAVEEGAVELAEGAAVEDGRSVN
jgi:hypothetical protein